MNRNQRRIFGRWCYIMAGICCFPLAFVTYGLTIILAIMFVALGEFVWAGQTKDRT